MMPAIVADGFHLKSALKHRGGGVHRTITATATCRRMEPLLQRIGVTRIADITGLDHLGIPVYSCIRPGANRNSVSVTCGKGTGRAQARAGAVMEALEYYSAEPERWTARLDTYEHLSRHNDVLDPTELILPVWSPYRADRMLEWVQGWDLVTGAPCWVPANAVFHPYLPESDALMILRASTNGLASGNILEEAICHALAELVERDCWSLCWVRAKFGRGDQYPGVDLEDAGALLRGLVGRFTGNDVEIYVRDIASDLGVPAYYAASYEEVAYGVLAHEGMGAHPDPQVALARALTEAAQSRAADIQGSREDISYWRMRAGNGKVTRRAWSITRPSSHRRSLTTTGARHADIRDDIRWMIERLAARGLTRVIAVDLTRAELEVPAVRVIVPGLEFVAVDEYRVGSRARAAAEEAQRRPLDAGTECAR